MSFKSWSASRGIPKQPSPMGPDKAAPAVDKPLAQPNPAPAEIKPALKS